MKIRNYLFFCLIFLLVGTSACSSDRISSVAAMPTTITPLASATADVPSSTPQPQNTPSGSPSATVTPRSERSHYILDVVLDTASHSLAVQEQIDYLNSSDQEYRQLPLVIPANRVEHLFTLQSIQFVDDPQTNADYTLDGELLTLSIAPALQPGQILSITLSYTLSLPDQNGPFGYTGRQYNLADWYPFIPPYQADSGWMINPYHPIGEYLVYDSVDFTVDIHLAEANPAMIIAAGAAAEHSENRWHYELPKARTFSWSASDEFLVLQQAERPNVTAYILPEHEAQGWSALATSISAMNLYSNLYGAYPHESLALVEADFYDGMEYDGLYFLGIDYFEAFKDGEKNYLTAIAAHETAHQWWFSAVGNDAAHEPWLDESLAIYSEYFFYRTYYPGDEDWWWNFRVAAFHPEGWVNSEVYPFTQYRPYINAVYLRGAQFLDEIRQTIGDEAFLAFIQDYYQQGSGKIMHRQDFFSILNQHTNSDLQPIISDYFSNDEG